MTKYRTKSGFLSLILLFIFLLSSCKPQTKQEVAKTKLPENDIVLSGAQIQLANIKVTEVSEGIIGHDLIFPGVLKVDELSAVNISSNASGRIQKLFFRNTGDRVNVGDPLYQIYSDELVNAEREYFTIQSGNWNFSGKYEPSLALENKLILLGMIPSQIAKLQKSGKILFTVTIYSPVKGIIRSINITDGQYVTAGQPLFELADDTKLWVEAPVYQEDLQFLKVGMPSIVTIPVALNNPIKCNINFINPSFEQGKNVTLIRAQITNRSKNLYPGMLALLSVECQKKRGIVVPASAVIREKDGSRVWVQLMNGSFSGRMVTTGIQSEDSVQILSGLEKADYVVTSGAYLLNSELILRKGTVAEGKTEM